MKNLWFQPLIWIDYRLAIVFAVIVPLILTILAFLQRIDAIGRLLVIYWRVSSLLLITVYLLIPGWTGENNSFETFCTHLGFFTAILARILIPISLWFWIDLNDEIKDLSWSSLKLALTSWRWAITIYSAMGIVFRIPFFSCLISIKALEIKSCQAWIAPPIEYWSTFHSNTTPVFLGFIGLVGLLIYAIYFIYFLLVRLSKQGRLALE
ncbi:DUF3177 family protein [Candidatus Atelocyanobacterium thalassae]|uniref:DUF3177 domain-containing protein n=1 Tax=cyanobacterium endosymbiont of Braarudosphaera bigelowii TaxID=1285375 RepID=A0ABN6K305_9CHRO|nr:DUF3177 family protein [Candidatus Atelocyanobacterium thalassa]BDA39907.1 hypothetical protein CPARK_000074700 [cyanobacterium endosymbiont of Braarudosphaera bigelowii]